jgi:HlyD family secretion protein
VKLFLILFVVAMGGLLAVGIVARDSVQGMVSSFKPEPARTDVRLDTVRRDRLIQTVSAPGVVEPFTKVDISAEVSARIEELPFDIGDVVRKGDLIVKLDDRDLQAALARAEASRDEQKFRLQSETARLDGLHSNLEFAQIHLKRQQDLYATGDVARKDLDDATERFQDLQATITSAQHTISVIESSILAAEADIAQAREALSNTAILSPIDGAVTQLNAEVGELVMVGTMNNQGTVILTIADLSRMILKAKVPESDIASVALDQPAKLHINAYADDVFTGRVTQVALQSTTELTGASYFETEVEIDLAGRRIYSGLLANVDIEVMSHEGMVVPSQAIVDRTVESLPDSIAKDHPLVDRSKKTARVVYRVVDEKTVCTPVKAGESDLTHTIILEGLSEGDQVVAGPYKVLTTIGDDELVRDLGAAGESPGGVDGADDDGKSRVGVSVSAG